MRAYLDGLIVYQGVYCNGSCLVVRSIRLFPKFGAPGGSQNGKSCVSHHCRASYKSKFGAILVGLLGSDIAFRAVGHEGTLASIPHTNEISSAVGRT